MLPGHLVDQELPAYNLRRLELPVAARGCHLDEDLHCCLCPQGVVLGNNHAWYVVRKSPCYGLLHGEEAAVPSGYEDSAEMERLM